MTERRLVVTLLAQRGGVVGQPLLHGLALVVGATPQIQLAKRRGLRLRGGPLDGDGRQPGALAGLHVDRQRRQAASPFARRDVDPRVQVSPIGVDGAEQIGHVAQAVERRPIAIPLDECIPQTSA